MSTNGRKTIKKTRRSADRMKLQDKLLIERGPTSQQAASRWVNWDSAEDILGQPFDATTIPMSKLHQMRRDPMIAFALLFVKVPLVRAPWYIKCADARIASFVDNALRRIYARFVLQYTNCLDYGYAPIEKRFEQIKPGWTYFDPEDEAQPEKQVWPEKGIDALVWKPFMAMPPEDVEPFWTREGEFGGINYRTAPRQPDFSRGIWNVDKQKPKKTKPDIPLEKALWATNEKDTVFGSLWGYPRVAYAYRYWWSYWFRWALADRHFEKDADPPMRVYYPNEDAVDEAGEDVDYSEAALALGADVRSGSTIAIPSDVVMGLDDKPTTVRKWEVDYVTAGGNFPVFAETFTYLDIMKLRSIMVPEQAFIEGGGGTSSRNVAAEMGDVFFESQAVLMGEIDDHLNRFVIPQIVEANFGPEIECRKETRGFAQQDVEMAKAIIQLFGQADPTTLEVDVREILGQMGIPLLNPAQLAKEQAEAERMAQESKPPETPARNGYAGVNQWGFYETPQETIHLAEWIPPSPHFEDDDVKATAVEMREFFEGTYSSQYDDFAKWLEGLAQERFDLSEVEDEEEMELAADAKAERRAKKLVGDWVPSDKDLRERHDRVAGWVRSVMDDASKREVTRLRVKDVHFSLSDSEIDRWANRHAAALVRNIDATTRKELRRFLAKEMGKEKSPPEIAKAVRKHFARFPGWKAERLARTETMLAYNKAALQTFQKAGIEHVRAHDAAIPERSDGDCLGRDGRIFTIKEALAQQILEHPNGTLAWSPVQPLSAVGATKLAERPARMSVVDDLTYKGRSVPGYYHKGEDTIYLDSEFAQDDEAVEDFLLALSERSDLHLGAYAKLKRAFKETDVKRGGKGSGKGGQFVDKPDAQEAKKVRYEARKEALEGRVKPTVEKGTKKGAPPVHDPQVQTGLLATGGARNPAGKISQKRLLQYVGKATSDSHGDVLSESTTARQYSTIEDGKRVYDPSRREVHEKIIEEILDDYPSQEEPTVTFTGGGYAAGKGTLVDKGFVEEPSDGFVLDPDKIKSMLPEFKALAETDPEANLAVYEEAWDIAQELQARAQARKINMVVDGISNTSPDEFMARVQSFIDAGYKNPKVVYVDAPTEEAMKRAKARAENPDANPSDRRYIPEVIMRSVHRDVAATVPGVMEAARQMDPDNGLTVEVYDNFHFTDPEKGDKWTGFTVPTKIAEVKPGDDGVTVHHPDIFDKFKAKAEESIPGVFEQAVVTAAGAATAAAAVAGTETVEHKAIAAAVHEIVQADPDMAVHAGQFLGNLIAAVPLDPHMITTVGETLSSIFHALPLSEHDEAIERVNMALPDDWREALHLG